MTFLDRLTLGPRRRQRAMMRRLRELDRLDARMASGPATYRTPRRGASRRLTTAVVVLLVLTLGVWSFLVRVMGYDATLSGLADAFRPGGDDAGSAGSYEFMATQPYNPTLPVRYSSCREVVVVVNEALAPDGTEGIVEESVEEVARLTGLDLRVAGTTGEEPETDRTRGARQPVLVAWTTPDRIPGLAGDVAGLGGSTQVRGGGDVRARYVSGQVALDAPQLGKVLERGGRDQVKAVVLHELGHLVGLAHTDDPTQLMHAESVGRTDFGAGDRAGLQLLGQGRC